MPRPSSFYDMNPVPHLWLPKGWDTAWRAAKAQAASTPARVAIFGDSISVGYSGPLIDFPNAWSSRLVAYLEGQLGTYGEYHCSGQVIQPTANWTAINAVTGWTLGQASNAWCGSLYNTTVPAVLGLQFVTPFACTALDLIFLDSGAGTTAFSIDTAGNTYTYQKDSAAAVTGQATGANVTYTSANDNALHRLKISALPNTTHTVQWGVFSAANPCNLIGAICYKPGATGGLFAARHEVYGMQGATGLTPKTLAGQQGLTAVSGGYPGAAHLNIVALSANDIFNANSVQTFLDTLTQAARAVKRAQSGGASTIFVITDAPNPNIDDSTGWGPFPTTPDYHRAIYHAAQEEQCAVVNFHQKWGPTALTQGLMNTDVHPTAGAGATTGQTDMYNTLLALV